MLKIGDVYVTSKGIKRGHRGAYLTDRQSVGLLFGSFPKGEVRRMRKALRANGYPHLAGADRKVEGLAEAA